MPHLDVKYRAGTVHESDLEAAADQLVKIVADKFEEHPAFVSLEIVPQHEIARNRKDVDLELNSSPDDEGHRAKIADALALELTQTLGALLDHAGYRGLEISAWVRIFDAGVYRYHRTRS